MPVTTASAASPGSPTKRISGSQNCEIQAITGVCSNTFIRAKTGIMTFRSRKEVFRPFVNPFFQVLAVINHFFLKLFTLRFGQQSVSRLVYWSDGVLECWMQMREKYIFYILSIMFPAGTKQDSFFFTTPLLHHSNTPDTINLRLR